MKIAILLPDLRGGGVERIRLVLAHQFKEFGHSVEFVLMQKQGELLAEAEADFSVIDLGTMRMRNLAFTLPHYLRKNRPDTLIAAMWPLTAIAPVLQRLSLGRCKVIVSEHNTLSLQYGNWGTLHRTALWSSMMVGYRLAHKRIGVSKGVVADIAQLSKLMVEKFDVIHNPLPVRPFPSAQELVRAEAVWGEAIGPKIVTVGTLKKQKNHSLLIQAFERLNDTNARLLLVGAGDEEQNLRKLAADLSVSQQVLFVGFQANPFPFYTTADLFVLSSNYEGFGNVIVEALSCGTPVVSTNCPSGPAEILENGRYGTLTTPGDPEELSRAIQTMLNSNVDREALKRRAAEFSPEIAARRYLELMRL